MSFLSNIFHTLVPISNLFTSSKPKTPSPADQLSTSIQPLIDLQKKQSEANYAAGTGDIATARTGLNKDANYWDTVLNGTPDELMKMFDASGITKQTDENEQQIGDLGVRGGARAATLGNASFSRDAELNRVLAQLRTAAPSQHAQLMQALANIGLGEESAAQGATAGASQNIFGIANVQLQQQQMHDQMIASIISSIAGAAGAAAGMGSDIAIKNNIELMTFKISKLNGITFNWNSLAAKIGYVSKKLMGGVLAQDVEKVFPEFVFDLDGIKRVNYMALTGILVEVVKSLETESTFSRIIRKIRQKFGVK